MYRATIYTDAGESYRLVYPDGRRGGEPLAAFHTMLATYTAGPETDEDEFDIFGWFARLEAESGVSLADVSAELVQGIHTGDLTADEYLLLSSVLRGSSEKSAEWRRLYEELKDKWVDAGELLANARVLWRVLASTELHDPVWLDVKWTAFELGLLIDVLELAIRRKAEQVTIQMR